MCGRFSLLAKTESLAQHFHLTNPIVMKPRYNIAPNEVVPVIKKWGEIDFLRWGYIPSFMFGKAGEKGFINIRSESVSEKPSFRHNFLKTRCIIPASGYYEWKPIGRVKQPYYIKNKDDSLFGFAGLWEGENFGILTVSANALLLPIHDRMPVILPSTLYAEWMNHKTPIEMLKNSLTAMVSERLEVYPVSPKMNQTRFEGHLCIESLQ